MRYLLGMVEVRFDDIPTLQRLVSDEFGDYGPKVQVSQGMIDQFADLTGDRQWIHVDVERATRESPFKTTIAHGFLLLSLLPKLIENARPRIVGMGSTVNYGAERLRFVSPVPAGSMIHARSRIVHVKPRAKGTQITTEVDIRVVGAPRPALLYQSVALLFPG